MFYARQVSLSEIYYTRIGTPCQTMFERGLFVMNKILEDLDDLSLRLKCAVEVLNCIHEALQYGGSCGKSYAEAVYGSYLNLGNLQNELQDLINSKFNEKESAA